MPTVDPTRLAEMYLAVGCTALTDYLDLIPPVNMWTTAYTFMRDSGMSLQGGASLQGMSFTRVASGKASTTGEAPMPHSGATPRF